VSRVGDSSIPVTSNELAPRQANASAHESRREVLSVPILSIQAGESPRLDGEDKAHIARLAEIEAPLPPILIDRRTMQIIDGTHRLMAALRRGQKTIEVEFFDGNGDDAFLRAVEENVTHGFPLTQADRRAAAVRIIESHPHMSDRAIAASAGLAARTVAAIRQLSADAVPQLNARVGRDGRVRPLNGVAGRQRVAELLAQNPQASLRQVAKTAGVSPTTVRDVRRRLESGGGPEPAKQGARDSSSARAGHDPPPGGAGSAATVGKPNPALLLETLLRDPSLRHNEQGRRLLRWLEYNAAAAQMWPGVIAAVPSHCATLIAQLARQHSENWMEFSQELVS
jgi:ParB-like chromosome segregation protein Spo0J